MGCGNSRRGFYATHPDVAKFRHQFDVLLMTEKEISRIHKIYAKVDTDKSGQISTLELFMALDVERNKFTERVFSIFDEDGSGQVDFREFVIALWNYCTLGRSTLVAFAFDLYDKDSSGEIDLHEVVQMLKDVYGKNYEKNVQARNVYEEIEKLDLNGDINTDSFREFARTHPALLFPAFQIQEYLQRRVLGIEFWEYYSNKRLELSKGCYVPISEFMEIHLRKNIQLKNNKNRLTKAGIELIANTGIHAKRLKKHGINKGETEDVTEELKIDKAQIARDVLAKAEREKEALKKAAAMDAQMEEQLDHKLVDEPKRKKAPRRHNASDDKSSDKNYETNHQQKHHQSHDIKTYGRRRSVQEKDAKIFGPKIVPLSPTSDSQYNPHTQSNVHHTNKRRASVV